MKKPFRLTEEEFSKLMEACKPTPAMWGSGGSKMFATPQDNANRAWKELGEKRGFVWDSCEPNGEDPRNFLAEPI